MIEPNNEMVEDVARRINVSSDDAMAAVDAVLTHVERNYRLTCPATFASGDIPGIVHCVLSPGHTTGHHGLYPNAGVSWL